MRARPLVESLDGEIGDSQALCVAGSIDESATREVLRLLADREEHDLSTVVEAQTEPGKAERASRPVVNDDGDPPAEGPGLGEGKGQPTGPESGACPGSCQ